MVGDVEVGAVEIRVEVGSVVGEVGIQVSVAVEVAVAGVVVVALEEAVEETMEEVVEEIMEEAAEEIMEVVGEIMEVAEDEEASTAVVVEGALTVVEDEVDPGNKEVYSSRMSRRLWTSVPRTNLKMLS